MSNYVCAQPWVNTYPLEKNIYSLNKIKYVVYNKKKMNIHVST